MIEVKIRDFLEDYGLRYFNTVEDSIEVEIIV